MYDIAAGWEIEPFSGALHSASGREMYNLPSSIQCKLMTWVNWQNQFSIHDQRIFGTDLRKNHQVGSRMHLTCPGTDGSISLAPVESARMGII
jgi:hypothetical protein